MDVLNSYVGDERDLKTLIGEFSLNSDYSPFDEFNVTYYWRIDGVNGDIRR